MDKKGNFLKIYFNGFKELFPFLTEKEFLDYYCESLYGGCPIEPKGSVWENEGKSIYILIRILKPKRILEIGNWVGTSANHILQAVENNKMGEVVLLDIKEYLNYNKLLNRNFERIIQNSLNYLNKTFNFDLIIQDGDHSYYCVKNEIELILRNNKVKNYFVWVHDYYSRYKKVGRAWNEMRNKFSQFVMFKSKAGILIVKK